MNILVCGSISDTLILTTEACQETFKIPKVSLNCDSEKVLYSLKCKGCGKVSYVQEANTKFCYRCKIYKSKHRAFTKGNQKVPQKLFHVHYCFGGHSGIDDWDFVISQQRETHGQLKERVIFWQHRLKIFYLIGVSEKEEYLYYYKNMFLVTVLGCSSYETIPFDLFLYHYNHLFIYLFIYLFMFIFSLCICFCLCIFVNWCQPTVTRFISHCSHLNLSY